MNPAASVGPHSQYGQHSQHSPRRPAGFGAGRSAAVVIASTAAAQGRAADTVGPELVQWLRGHGYDCPEPIVVADGAPVARELTRLLVTVPQQQRPRFLITSGGTGINPDDATPESTAPLLQRQSPGIMHALWAHGLQHLPEAAMSRGVAGVRGRTFVANLPGSPGGARDGMTVLDPLLHHIQAQLEDVRDHPDAHRDPMLPETDDAVRAHGTPELAEPPSTGTASVGESPHSVDHGSEQGVIFTAVTHDLLDAAAAEAAVTTRHTGAAVTFRGVIRDHDSGRDDIIGLSYTGHPAAEDILAETVARLAVEYPATRIWCAHRLGDLSVGEDALVVSVASAHRAEAFACCAAVVDAVKAEVPIWKQQHYAAGGHDWIGL